MKTINTDKDFKTYIHEIDEPVDVREELFKGQLIPIAVHVLPQGTIDDKPSVCFELTDGHGIAYAQISKRMLKDMLEALK